MLTPAVTRTNLERIERKSQEATQGRIPCVRKVQRQTQASGSGRLGVASVCWAGAASFCGEARVLEPHSAIHTLNVAELFAWKLVTGPQVMLLCVLTMMMMIIQK